MNWFYFGQIGFRQFGLEPDTKFSRKIKGGSNCLQILEHWGCGGLGTALESVICELEKMVKLDHKELEKSISRKSNDVTPERLLYQLSTDM